ncbi:MAG TPA: signal peptidase I [Verrucomicrobiae bacterium]|nr:signal peptidase I [Verrucomicrobiae bacterium]
MSNSEDRQTLKSAREMVQGARKWLRINRDLIAPGQIVAITMKIGELEQALRLENAKAAASRSGELEQKIRGALPAPKSPALRENIEVLLVAVIVAMAVRTFFIQPFKIPTGSMQPTLYGVYPPPNEAPSRYVGRPPSILERLAGVVFQGRMYEPYGYRTRGDHIFVDKISYHFRKPRRGEVIVFDTTHIPEIPAPSRGNFYIKRLIGLENDVIQIQPPYVLVNGRVLDGRDAFRRIYSQENGYNGYVIPETFPSPKYFPSSASTYTVPPKHLFPMGDNSKSSLDGRFWGSVPQEDLVGRAVFVYWPFSKRFGLVN